VHVYSCLSSEDGRRLQVAFNSFVRSMFSIFIGMIICLFILGLSFLMVVSCLFFYRLVRSERPGYIFSGLRRACSPRTDISVVPELYPRGSFLVRGIRL
jgi:hypothetical protein